MAVFTQTQSRNAGLLDRIATHAKDAWAAAAKHMARRRIANVAYAELSSLSTRELNDLGISRSRIRALAWETARNAG